MFQDTNAIFVEKSIDNMLHFGDTKNSNAKKTHRLNALCVTIKLIDGII